MARNLLGEIQNRMSDFSKSQKLISNYILENYDKAAYMTASKLGATVKVSESTVVRYAIELGFDGYPEFQHSLQEIVRTKLTSFQRMEVTNSLIGDGDALTKVLMSDIDKIKRTVEDIDHEAFEAAVNSIVGAKNIYIIGIGSASVLASALNINLRMIFDNVRFIVASSATEIYEQIISIGKGDVMVAISFPRYSKKVVSAVNLAKKSGADVIALTDSAASPIASLADQNLFARSDMASFADSLVAPLSVINALVVEVSRRKQDELTVRLRQLEQIWEEYNVYDTNQG
ncbi:MAG: MurR/RpiR family transcriptional regulator [Clostridia bacterium]|nr:MurR/RpiR family transcriptional regulator [Clostridia bacterium]MBR2850196.1 MurR/RpiR family transcriptional regulator [Clostridia bacterium]